MGFLTVGVAHLQLVGLDQCRTVHAVPIGHRFVVLRGLVFTAVFELNDVFAAGVFFGDSGPCAIIEDVAVLQDFDEGRAFVSGGMF